MENTNDNDERLKTIQRHWTEEVNRSGHIPCWTEPMEPKVIEDHIDPAGQAAAGIQSAVSHLAQRRVWNAVLNDKESAAQLMEDTGNLLLLMSALIRDLARR